MPSQIWKVDSEQNLVIDPEGDLQMKLPYLDMYIDVYILYVFIKTMV